MIRQTSIMMGLLMMGLDEGIEAFCPGHLSRCDSTTTQLGMGKKSKNKQMELQRIFAETKKQEDESAVKEGKKRLTDEEIKEQNDRKRFDELLRSQGGAMAFAEDEYKSTSQQEAEIELITSKGFDSDILFEGDPAPEEPFENLVLYGTTSALGASGAKRWIQKFASTDSRKYLVVITDPREKSEEMQEVMQALAIELPMDIRSNLILINADTPAQNRKWLKKNSINNLSLFSDEKREWMRSYSALGDKRWSMTMFVLSGGRIERLVREFDTLRPTKVVQNAVASLLRES